MRPNRRDLLSALPILVGLPLLAACGAGTDATSSGEGVGGDATSGTTTSSTGSSGQGGASATTGSFMSGTGGAPSEVRTCSADLKQILDENGMVLETCGPNEGCAGGVCVAACDAAAASKGSLGCDYVLSTPNFLSVPAFPSIRPPCFAAFVANSWDRDIVLEVRRAGQTFDVTQFGRVAQPNPDVATWPAVPASGLPPGEVAVLFLSHDPQSSNLTPLTCPIAPAISGTNGTGVIGTGVGTAWSITTDAPVTVYDILPYGGADSYLPSAQLVLPTTAWGTNYVAVLPPGSNSPYSSLWGQVVAREPTTIQILANVNLPGGGSVPPISAGVQSSFTLQAGEFIQWDGPAMSGTVLQSDKPIAFLSGNTYQCYTSTTSSGGGCDSGHQQIAPVSALGSEYVGIPFTSRGLPVLGQESIFYRILGVADGTLLTFDPPIPGAPSVLSLGQVVDFEAQTPFRVTSQSDQFPFYIGEAMSGCNVPGNGAQLGDEDFVNLLPPAQWLSKYVFFSDPTYPTTNLVFVRKKAGGAFADVNLECLGVIGGWTPVGTNGDYEITNVDLIRDGLPNGACNNGPQVASSTAPFGLMVWGLDYYSSYGYPAGGNAATINTVVVPPEPPQ
jgi:hypothetical protein